MKRLRFHLLVTAAISIALGVVVNQVFAQSQSAYFTFGTASTQPTVGKSFSVPLIIDTGTQNVSGADAVIRYDPQALEVVSVDNGVIFDNYPPGTYDRAGNIQLSGTMSETTASFSGRGTFGTITFRGIQAGSTSLLFTCTENQQNESNILQAITNLDIIDCNQTESTTLLIAAAPATPAPPTPLGQPATSPTASPSSLGNQGSVEFTLIVAGGGLALLILGGFLRWSHQV